LKATSGKELGRLLEARGWELRSVRGSHHVYTKPGNAVRISVPIHGNKPLKIGLLKHLLRLAGIAESEL